MKAICIECAKEPHLKKKIKIEGATQTCFMCEKKGLAVDFEKNDFFQLVKALVRFHYSEWEYNGHLGGDGYESLFYGSDNIFFEFDRAVSVEVYEELVGFITDGDVYETYEKGISIFAGYGEGDLQNMPLRAIKSDMDRSLIKISNRLKTENYFHVEHAVKAILEKYISVAERKITEKKYFFRARVGYKEEKNSMESGFEMEAHYLPYSEDQIGAPLPNIATSGRINRPGVSYLYCATDKHTAISEVRPHPGDHVSIGKFDLKRDVRLYDLSESQLLHFSGNDKDLDNYIPFNTLGSMINKPIPPSKNQHYSITQSIADCIRQLGFDGIFFSSTVGSGYNVVFYDHRLATYNPDEAEVVEVTKVKYDYQSKPSIVGDGFYMEKGELEL